jgi:hypothetical protein
MGHIKWKALPVSRMLDAVEEQLEQAKPFIDKARELAKEAMGTQAFPQYMQWDIQGVHSELDYAINRCQQSVDRCRRDLPADAIAREEGKEKSGQQQSISLGV